MESGREWSRVELTAALLKSLDRDYRKLLRGNAVGKAPTSSASISEASSFARGRHVPVEEDGGYEGITEGLDDRGFLLVRTDGGLRTVFSGGVRRLKFECIRRLRLTRPSYAFSSRCRQHQHGARRLRVAWADWRASRYGPLIAHWRVTTIRTQTVDEYGVLFRNLFAMGGIDVEAIHGIVISSVVPPLDSTLREVCEKYFNTQAAVHRARREDRHAGALRQSRRSGRRPHRQQCCGV